MKRRRRLETGGELVATFTSRRNPDTTYNVRVVRLLDDGTPWYSCGCKVFRYGEPVGDQRQALCRHIKKCLLLQLVEPAVDRLVNAAAVALAEQQQAAAIWSARLAVVAPVRDILASVSTQSGFLPYYFNARTPPGERDVAFCEALMPFLQIDGKPLVAPPVPAAAPDVRHVRQIVLEDDDD